MSNFIKQVVLDIHYTSSYPSAGFIGELYELGYTDVVETPFYGIPKEIRTKNPDFVFQPMYEVTSIDTNYKVSVGDNTFGINTNRYESWSDFIKHAKEVFSVLFSKKNSNLSIARIGLRYLYLIGDKNIFDDKHIVLKISGKDRNKSNMINLRFDNEIRGYKVVENIIYPFNDKSATNKVGTFIDIITVKENLEISGEEIDKEFYKIINDLHRLNKEQFREILPNDLRREIGI